MKTILYILLIAVAGIIIFLIVINIITLRRVIKNSKDPDDINLSDKRYYELNNKIQLFIVVTSIVFVFITFTGHEKIDDVLKEQTSIIENYNNKINKYDKSLSISDSLTESNITIINELRDSIRLGNQDIIKIKNSLEMLQNQYRISSKTYLVRDFKILKAPENERDKPVKVYFKELNKFNINIPSIFSERPYVILRQNGSGSLTIKEIQRDYFIYEYGGVIEGEIVVKDIISGNYSKDKIYPNDPDDATQFDIVIIEEVSKK